MTTPSSAAAVAATPAPESPASLPASSFTDLLHTIGLNMTAWALFVVCDTINKWLSGHYPVLQINATSALIGLVMTTVWIAARYGMKGFLSKKWKYHVARGICYIVSSFCGVMAVSRIPLADFYGIVFLSPLLIALLAHFILKEQIGPHRIAAILIGFGGVLIITGAHIGDFNIGYLCAMAGAVATSFSGIFVRKIGKEKAPSIFAFYLFLVASCVFVPAALPHFVMPSLAHVPLFLAIPPLALVALVTYAVSFSRVSETALIAPFHYTQMIWGSVIGYVIFGDIPGPATMAGASVIIGAGLYLIWREHYRHVKHPPNPPPRT
jgi:S-adenosylmethionine uptake transporter